MESLGIIEKYRTNGIKGMEPHELEELVSTLFTKRQRAHLRDFVSHKLLDMVSLEERCSIIIGCLADDYSDKAEGYKFSFDEVGLYLAENGHLRLIEGRGSPDELISSTNHIFNLESDIDYSNGGQIEIAIPLTANGQYQGTLVLSNKKTQRKILPDLYDFLHSYCDIAAGAIYSAREHIKIQEQTQIFEKLIHAFTHDSRNSAIIPAAYTHKLEEKISKYLSSPNPEMQENIKYMLGVIGKGIEELQGIIEDYSSLTMTKNSLKIADFDFKKYLEQIPVSIQETAKKKGMAFVYKIDEELSSIKADERLIRGIYRNIVGNAVKHGQPGPIEIEAGRCERGIYLKITNSGRIEDKSRMFDMFYTTNEQGSGIGMSIIKNNLSMMDGKINVDNYAADGKNRVFVEICIPSQQGPDSPGC